MAPDDLEAACAAGPDAVVVPKVGSADAVLELVEAMAGFGAPDHTKLWAMVETPAAMLHAEEIAAASDRLTVLVMGTNDLAKELYAEHVPGRHPLLPGLGLALLAARATGTAILDGVFNDVQDADGFLAECRQGREMGFDGKTLIHPVTGRRRQRGVRPERAGGARTPEGSSRPGTTAPAAGVVTYRGRMVENLHVETCTTHARPRRGDPTTRIGSRHSVGSGFVGLVGWVGCVGCTGLTGCVGCVGLAGCVGCAGLTGCVG